MSCSHRKDAIAFEFIDELTLILKKSLHDHQRRFHKKSVLEPTRFLKNISLQLLKSIESGNIHPCDQQVDIMCSFIGNN